MSKNHKKIMDTSIDNHSLEDDDIDTIKDILCETETLLDLALSQLSGHCTSCAYIRECPKRKSKTDDRLIWYENCLKWEWNGFNT